MYYAGLHKQHVHGDELPETKRPVSYGAEQLLLQPIQCLDHGSVTLVDYLGNDNSIVAAARVSYAQDVNPAEHDRNNGLINYLLRNDHTSPFEQVVLTFKVKLPIFVARQLVRHRTARLNEVSGRYTILPEEVYTPEIDRIQGQSKVNKQGSSGDLEQKVREDFLSRHHSDTKETFEHYRENIQDGIAKELSRIDLPLSTYTAWIWQMDLNNLFRFLRLRLDSHAQWEIRTFAEAKSRIARQGWPMAYGAFDEHILRARKLSGTQAHQVRELLNTYKLQTHLYNTNLPEWFAKLEEQIA